MNVIDYNYFIKVIMITYDYFPWVKSFRIEMYVKKSKRKVQGVPQLCMYLLCMTYRGMNMNEKKCVAKSGLIFAILISFRRGMCGSGGGGG